MPPASVTVGVSRNVHPSDISHWWGQDWALTPTGDIQVVDGIPRSNQRIFRRLCTNGSLAGAKIGEYAFHLTYGGAAPWYVGRTTEALALAGIIRDQMYAEASVSHIPEPKIKISFTPDGSYLADIQYIDQESNQPVPPLTLSVSP
jgi:hypothetical protein